MKKLFFLFPLLFSLVFAQSVKINKVTENGFLVELSFNEPNFSEIRKGKFVLRDYYEFQDYSKNKKYNLPSRTLIFAIPPNSKPKITVINKETESFKNTIPILNPSAEKLNDSTLTYKYSNIFYDKTYSVPSDFEIEKYFWYRNFYCVSVKINTHKFFPSENKLSRTKKIKLKFSFNNDYNLKNFSPIQKKNKFDSILEKVFANDQIAEQFRSVQPKDLLPDTTYQWIDFDADYLKIKIISNGIYRLTGNDFINAGVSLGDIIPQNIKLYESGKEIPLFISDNGDGSFDENDYLEFYGRENPPFGNYKEINNDNEDYNEFKNRYCDTSYYFITWNAGNGKRIFIQSLFDSSLNDTIDYYNEVLHFERNNWIQNMNGDESANQMADWHKNKTWYWFWLGYWSPNKVFKFDAPDFVPEKNGKAYFKAAPAGLSSRMSFMLNINNTRIDSQRISRYHQVLLNGEFSTSILQESNNDFNVKCLADDGNYAATDWYEVDYPKYASLINDSLTFEVYNDVSPGEKIVKIENANSGNYLIYKIFPRLKKIDNYQVIDNTIFFSDTLTAGDKYFIVSENKIKSPISIEKKRFINLRSTELQADYIAITHPIFGDAVDNYLSYISEEYHVNVFKAYVSDIFDEFSFGYPYPEALRLFLYKAYVNWQAPKVSYVNLIGDASYDYKYTKFINEGVKVSYNYVPSIGYPVGDNKLAVWDNDGLPLPQLVVGRLPVLSQEEIFRYLQKIQISNQEAFDEWNKRTLFFSGGDNNNPNEINMFKSTNDEIINSYIKPPTFSAKYNHFYKTYNPPTDFGPFTQDEVNNAINEGGVLIGYLGHSGTATWDNGINSIIQLQNNYGKHPLITDFGCSTNKFAEPDMVCFGERFVLDEEGQAIAYFGNSSLGFTSTSTRVSKLFYEKMIRDSILTIGEAHLATKAAMFNNFGGGNVYKVFSYSNTLLGEPLFQVKIPPKPNLSISSSSLITNTTSVDEETDSLELLFEYKNLGLQTPDSMKIEISENYYGNVLSNKILYLPLPAFKDTISFVLHSKGNPGIHVVSIKSDSENSINEIDENDNDFNFEINVYSTAIRDLIDYSFLNGEINNIKILNPVLSTNNENEILFYLDDNEDFSSPITYQLPMADGYTKITPNNISSEKRYWYKYKINSEDAEFGYVKSFYKSNEGKYLIKDSLAFTKQQMNSLGYNNSGVKLVNDSINIAVLSAGAYSGATCVISKNGENLLSNTFMAGMGVAVFDSVSLAVDTAFSILLFQRPDNVQALADFINGVPTGKIVAMGIMNDARNNMSNELRNAIKTLGSTLIDSLQFQGPWALIGFKGASPEQVIEEVKDPYEGQIYIDTTYVLLTVSGSMVTSRIGPASEWENIVVKDSVPDGASINYKILAENLDGKVDTISNLSFSNGVADISFLNDSAYSYIKILSEINASPNYDSPVLKTIGVNYKGFPELGINYQTVWLDKDTVNQGESITLNFKIFNPGEISADSFKTNVNILRPDNSSFALDSFWVNSLPPDTNVTFSTTFNTMNFKGNGFFTIQADSKNSVREYYEDNNFFRIPFYVVEDTSKPLINLTIDGEDISDEVYVSDKPEIKITLADDFPLAITDTSSILIYLNDKQIYYSNPEREDVISDENPKYTVIYKPKLKTGEYTISVNGKDANGNFAYENGMLQRNFKVSTNAELLQLFNYPNPFENNTYFTFKLTQIPDEFKIRIFTIAGRLIREINVEPSELNYDFNRIYWDGRDEDGSEIANGVYLYKVILKKGDEVVTKIQKIAKVR